MSNKKRCLKFQIREEGRFFILGLSVHLSPRRRGGGGGGDTLIFSYVGGLFFGVQNFELQYLFIYLLLLFFLGGGGGGGEVQKTEYFWGMKILWIFLGGHHK